MGKRGGGQLGARQGRRVSWKGVAFGGQKVIYCLLDKFSWEHPQIVFSWNSTTVARPLDLLC